MLNIHSTLQTRTSLGHYTAELLRCLRQHDPDCVRTYPTPLVALAQQWYGRQSVRYEESAKRSDWASRLQMHARGKFLALVRRTVLPPYAELLTKAARSSGCDVYHETSHVPVECDLPTVTTVHDLSALLYPQWHAPNWADQFEREFVPGLRRCSHLLAISESGKREIVEHLGWPEEKVSVTCMGVRPGLRRVVGGELADALRVLNLLEGYLLHVGTLEPRKNIPLLLRAYSGLPASLRDRHPLVFAGPPGWNSDEVLAAIHEEARQHNVHWLGYVPENLLAALYSGARALVFPSLYESFGMPTIEMMACGGAVLASRAAAETVSRNVHLIDPHDEAGWRDAMLRVCRDRQWRLSLREGAREAVAGHTWERCVEQTLAVYRSVVPTALERQAV
jgi:alpha-1,3-rhamnosyl/mannosyltransferase